MYMIKGSWDMLHLFCAFHDPNVELVLERTPHGIIFKCPAHAPEHPCATEISQFEFEEILRHYLDQIVRAELDGEVIDLTNSRWATRSKVVCTVCNHKKERVEIMIDCSQRIHK